MEKDIDTYEFEWWPAFTGYVVLFVVSIISIYAWLTLDGLVQERFAYKLYLLFLPAIFFVYFSPSIIDLFSRPKTIIFKENRIIIIGPMNHEKDFTYADISRLVVYHKYTYSRFYKAVLYFAKINIKVTFNPDRLPDFSNILETIRNKGLGYLIEQK